MNKQDIDYVNKAISDLGDKVYKVLEILQDEKLTNKHAREKAEKELDNIMYEIPVFMELKNDN